MPCSSRLPSFKVIPVRLDTLHRLAAIFQTSDPARQTFLEFLLRSSHTRGPWPHEPFLAEFGEYEQIRELSTAVSDPILGFHPLVIGW